MRIVTATFVNNEIEPGWLLLKEDIPLGRRYQVDLDQVESFTLTNPELGKARVVPYVYVVEPAPPGWLPLAAFKIDPDA